MNQSTSTEFTIIVSDYTLALNKGLNKLQIYPNPADNYLMIELPESAENITTISLFNSFGRLIHLYDKELQNKNQVVIDISALENGVYFLKVCSGRKCVTKKISVIHQK